ncbi:ATP-dependent endonuclease [Streptomyces iconiensis]|uniref:ATP-dependent endonuclease n=2 Tax=Streptomyces iconiensis TaxID=1384038 RepID=A0ABT6ZQ81_9ACTN|nr:ATP-dependent endonuclease [Streptomyces iconiensis]MDJ1131206.1 ATP-dependent endonuclease [Streptomyces iconiensis]
MERFRSAAVAWAAGGVGAGDAGVVAQGLAGDVGVRTVVLVEGVSDQVAFETLAARRGRALGEEGVSVVPLGGATSIGRYLALLGPGGLNVGTAGLCDAEEERFFRRALERNGSGPLATRADLERLGFFVCVADLEDELIRCLGPGTVCDVLGEEGDLRAFRTFQKQLAQRERTVEQQLRRFLGTTRGRKAHYARSLVEALGPAEAPTPLERLLAYL